MTDHMGEVQYTDLSTTSPRCIGCGKPTPCVNMHGPGFLCPTCNAKRPHPGDHRDRLAGLLLECDECGRKFEPLVDTKLILVPAHGEQPACIYCEGCAAIESQT